ncbi:major facilitator superfamily transporter [Annulohypoxylon maeteangense]|uniref:major facilitator superfamily transporter n=1 Tax=Annulohypoxylon maeteangense TaxID=1927788 RepID=UPI0020072EAC|nr:major facilitator superfamily transporter [Annulohypoxylon maeteangense]KAI0889599.1 major facilitator superfamily transporter [Annulohypoxylon maeteangense]
MEPHSENANRSEDAETIAVGSSDSSLRLELAPPELPLLRYCILSVGIQVGLLLSFLDTSIVATSLFAIGIEFKALTTISWVALAYSLAYLGCAVLFARISDIIGRRDAFLVSYIIFIAFSLACGFAKSLTQLIAFRTAQGLGGSGLYSITMIILPEISPRKAQKFLGGMIGIVVAMAGVLGPVLGGLLTEYTSWRWIFWINGPIGGASMLLFFLMWPKPQYLPNTERRTWRELDYLGSILLIGAAVLVVFPFQNVGTLTDRWSQAVFIIPLIIGVILWLTLFAWSIFIEKRWVHKIVPALPMRLLRNRVYAAAVLNTLLIGFPYLLIIYAFPLRLQIVNGKDSLLAGVMLLPMLGSSAVGSVISGAFNSKGNRTFELQIVASCFVVLGCGLLSTLSSSFTLEPKALGFLVFVGLGFGIIVSTATIAATVESSTGDHAVAQGVMAQVRVLGGSIGIAASSAIVGTRIKDQVGSLETSWLPSPEGAGDGLTHTQQIAVQQAYSDAFNEDMRVCAIIGAFAILVSFGMFSRRRLIIPEHSEQHTKERAEKRKSARISTVPTNGTFL